jgi:hypothetical protein
MSTALLNNWLILTTPSSERKLKDIDRLVSEQRVTASGNLKQAILFLFTGKQFDTL